MVSANTPIPAAHNSTSGGRDTKITKRLADALRKREMMVMAGAPAASIDAIEARIARLGGAHLITDQDTPSAETTAATVHPITDAPSAAKGEDRAEEDGLEAIRRLTAARIAVIEAKRARVAALRAALEAAEADLDATLDAAWRSPLGEGIAPLMSAVPDTDPVQPAEPAVEPDTAEPETAVEPDTADDVETSTSPGADDEGNPWAGLAERAAAERAERERADAEAVAVLGEAFGAYEPAQVLAVARGGSARWVRGDDGRWYVAVRETLTVDGRWAEIERRDGSVSVELLSEAVAVTEMGGVWVAVCSVVPDTKVVA